MTALSACRVCGDVGWVCENHADRAFDSGCCGGAGMPCGACNLEMASAGYVEQERERIIGWLKTFPPSYSGWNDHDELFDAGHASAILDVIKGIEKRAYASADTHPKDGDVEQAPLVSGAVPERQTPNE